MPKTELLYNHTNFLKKNLAVKLLLCFTSKLDEYVKYFK